MGLFGQRFWLSFFLREGTRQAEMLAFPFAAAREPAKLAERVLSGLRLRGLWELVNRKKWRIVELTEWI